MTLRYSIDSDAPVSSGLRRVKCGNPVLADRIREVLAARYGLAFVVDTEPIPVGPIVWPPWCRYHDEPFPRHSSTQLCNCHRR